MAAINGLLIVDDKQEITDLVEVFAQGAGYEVLSINDSGLFEQALEQLKPAVIFLDMTMPGCDGMALLGLLASSNYPSRPYSRFQCCVRLLGDGAISRKLSPTAISCRMASADSISVTY